MIINMLVDSILILKKSNNNIIAKNVKKNILES